MAGLMLVGGGNTGRGVQLGWSATDPIVFTSGGTFDLDTQVIGSGVVFGVDASSPVSEAALLATYGVTMTGARKNVLQHNGLTAIDTPIGITFQASLGTKSITGPRQISVASTLSWAPAAPANIGAPPGGSYDLSGEIIGQQAAIELVGTPSAGVTLDQANERINVAANAVPGSVSTFRLNLIQDAALADWNTRINGAGVLWATLFESTADVLKWPGHGVTPEAGILDYMAGRGVISGKGCLRQTMPIGSAGVGPGSGNAFIYGRPIQPFATDINRPGVATIANGAANNFLNLWNNGGVGYIANAAYAGSHGTPARTATGGVIGNEVWFQFRIRFSPNRFTLGQGTYSKMVMFETNYTSSLQELVLHGYSPGHPLSRIPILYTSKGSAWNTGLSNPQESGGGGTSSAREPGYPNVCTYDNPGQCWVWPTDTWVTVLIRWQPGLQYLTQVLNPPGAVDIVANAAAANTRITMYVATAGAPYTLIHDKSNYVWWYEEGAVDSVGGHPCPYGLNWINLNYFTGGIGWLAQPTGWYHEFDQLICSLQSIPAPQA